MAAYYNEYDPFAASWLRELIKAGHIAPGDVDDRSILDVDPDELAGYTQCHFFAGIGVWSYALRRAGWSDDRPVWTGSPPCQPFSSAGKQLGTADERHLWPAFFNLIKERGPQHVFGEQVAAAIGQGWFDALQSDLAAEDYATGMVVLPACGVGAPHIRQRLWFVAERMADTESKRRDRLEDTARTNRWAGAEASCDDGRMADTELQQRPIAQAGSDDAGGRLKKSAKATGLCGDSGSGFDSIHLRMRGSVDTPIAGSTMPGVPEDNERECDVFRPGPTNGFWRDADWLYCRDGKWRPVEPGLEPLVNWAPARVGRLRGYGNAINAEAARAFIEAYMSQENK